MRRARKGDRLRKWAAGLPDSVLGGPGSIERAFRQFLRERAQVAGIVVFLKVEDLLALLPSMRLFVAIVDEELERRQNARRKMRPGRVREEGGLTREEILRRFEEE